MNADSLLFANAYSEPLKKAFEDSNAPLESIKTLHQQFRKECNNFEGDTAQKEKYATDQKSMLEMAFRQLGLSVEKKHTGDVEDMIKMLELAFACVETDLMTNSVVIASVVSFFEALPLNVCEPFFGYLESKMDILQKFSRTDKNHILRICNMLLRRLSKSQNTMFCGRILVFLAKFFSLCEKSGVNIGGQFNVDNLTSFDPEPMEVDQVDQSTLEEDQENDDVISRRSSVVSVADAEDPNATIDYELYRRFWQLQSFFSNPQNCFNGEKFAEFQKSSVAVLDTLLNDKLTKNEEPVEKTTQSDDQKELKDGEDEERKKAIENTLHTFFPKFLSSRNLIGLQLQDPNFRATILVQMLILCQYLMQPPPANGGKPRKQKGVLASDALEWVTKTHDRCVEMAASITSSRSFFQQAIRHFLERESSWVEWKENDCTEFEISDKKADYITNAEAKSIKRARTYMGSKKLTTLWKTDSSDLEGLAGVKWLPDFDEFFNEAIEQCDPEAGIEEEYKKTNDLLWLSRASRLMSQNKPQWYLHVKKIQMSDCTEKIYKQRKEKEAKKEEANGTNENVDMEVEDKEGKTDDHDELDHEEDAGADAADEKSEKDGEDIEPKMAPKKVFAGASTAPTGPKKFTGAVKPKVVATSIVFDISGGSGKGDDLDADIDEMRKSGELDDLDADIQNLKRSKGEKEEENETDDGDSKRRKEDSQ